MENIQNASPNHSYPISYYNLVYTGTSNCHEPTKFNELGTKIWNVLTDYKYITNFDKETFVPNSVYCQLFGENSTLALHKDEYCDWGISLSIGSSCDFVFGKDKIVLNSGDVFIADFSKVTHGVTKVHDNLPGFMDEETGCGVKTFGMSRLSVQIRDIDTSMFKRDNMLSIEEFKNMVVSY